MESTRLWNRSTSVVTSCHVFSTLFHNSSDVRTGGSAQLERRIHFTLAQTFSIGFIQVNLEAIRSGRHQASYYTILESYWRCVPGGYSAESEVFLRDTILRLKGTLHWSKSDRRCLP